MLQCCQGSFKICDWVSTRLGVFTVILCGADVCYIIRSTSTRNGDGVGEEDDLLLLLLMTTVTMLMMTLMVMMIAIDDKCDNDLDEKYDDDNHKAHFCGSLWHKNCWP